MDKEVQVSIEKIADALEPLVKQEQGMPAHKQNTTIIKVEEDEQLVPLEKVVLHTVKEAMEIEEDSPQSPKKTKKLSKGKMKYATYTVNFKKEMVDTVNKLCQENG